MSLLHKALKKAEKEGGSAENQSAFVDTEELPKPSSFRIPFLASIAIASLLFVVYVRFVRKPSSSAFAPKEFTTPLQIGGGPAAPELASRALDLIQRGQFEEAKNSLEKVVILEPRNAEAYNNLGFALKKLGRSGEASEQYRRALSIDPNCTECLNNLGLIYLSNRELTEAETQFQKAIGIKPDYADPYFHLGLLYEARGDLTAAKKNYLKFVELVKDVDASFLLKVQQRIASLQTP